MEVLELKHITKQYPGVTALDDVSISFKKGEVHALIGENGGTQTFHTGPGFPAYLQIPVIPPKYNSFGYEHR